MKINDWYPKPRDLVNCELKTLVFLKDNSTINAYFPDLSADAYQYYARLKSGRRVKFSFESELEIRMERKKGHAHVGANLMLDRRNNYKGISYYMAICNDNRPRARLIRKFHFDYALPNPSQRQPHPIFHLQYAGKLSARLKAKNLEHGHIDAWLSEPRVCYTPMSLALLINMILKEFPNETNTKLIETPEWRKLIRTNENLLLAPFYKVCHNFMSDRRSEQLFTNDFYYGN